MYIGRNCFVLSYMHLDVGSMESVEKILSWEHGDPILKKRRGKSKTYKKKCNIFYDKIFEFFTLGKIKV